MLKEISGDWFYVEALVDTPYFYELGAQYCEAYRFAYRFLMAEPRNAGPKKLASVELLLLR